METRRMLLIPHQLRFWYKRAALTSVSGSAHFVNLAFRGIICISCPFQWFQFGENRTSTAQDMIKRVMVQKSDGAVMLSPHHGGAVGHISLLVRILLHSDNVRYRMATRRMLLIPHQLRV